MAYEEASVAGETPDRSKQRKSSGNPTPEETSGPAPEERDPRLAMTRETPQVREDRATAVFSTKDVAEAAAGSDGSDGPDPGPDLGTASEPEPEPEPGPETEPEAASESESGDSAEGEAEAETADAPKQDAPKQDAPKAEANGDARLRDAVAAWVATSDDPEPESASESESESAEESSDATDKPEAADEPKPKPKSDPKPEPSAKDDAEADAEAEDTPEEAEDTPKSTGVDQATAVFKALPPKGTGKAVDQPTTMLKLGDHKDPKGEGAKGTAKAKPEGEAERTSKFVALKPLDEPSARTAPKTAPKGEPAAAPESKAPSKAEPKVAPKAAPKDPKAKAAPAAPVAPAGPAVPPPVERTTQQPLPPKPPIDLLAELTNTPPPPETPVRTAVRRVKIWTPLVLLLIVVFAVVQAVRPLPTPTLQLTAQESVSFEGDKPDVPWPSDGQAAMDVNGIGTFGTSGDQKPVPIASIAKVMTVYLILRDHPLEKGKDGPKIPVDAAAQKHYETGKPANESVVKVTEGQKITEYEALQAVMLPSANNVAKLLARWDTKSSSEDEFVAKMNKTAKELGMKNTHYTDPSGLDKTTVSTAEDLVKLGRAAMENPVFNEISRQPSYTDLNNDKQTNFFKLVPTVAIGIKTGTTTAAGGNILFAAEKVIDGKRQTIIGAALGQYGTDGVANIDKVTNVTKDLIAAGQDALKAKTIVKKGDVVGNVDDGLGGTTPVVATKDVSAVGWSGLTVKLQLDDIKGKTIPNTAKAGTKVGVLHVGDGKGDAVEVPVALQKDLSEPGFGAKLTRVG
ncbi:D-alanyl-D-alanine carboxypeptidase [Streptomyces sp. NPDC004732]|uniref:D-alanyl-D-alanine carboxypeptidase n=1 Tax=Streptomyces sp. NPDC004732 TaxID=3154290 RepID=UPI0033BEAA34